MCHEEARSQPAPKLQAHLARDIRSRLTRASEMALEAKEKACQGLQGRPPDQGTYYAIWHCVISYYQPEPRHMSAASFKGGKILYCLKLCCTVPYGLQSKRGFAEYPGTQMKQRGSIICAQRGPEQNLIAQQCFCGLQRSIWQS